MTGAGKLAVTSIGAIIMLSGLAAGGQQPSNAPVGAQPDTPVAPVLTAPRVPADMPPNPPKVTCDGDTLTISAENSTLGAVLNAIRTCTGAQIDVPEDARGERLFAELGPGPLRTVLADFLSSTDFNYVIKASPSDPQKVQMVLLNPRPGDSASEIATVAGGSTNTNMTLNRQGWLKARENYMKSFTAARDDSNPATDAASPPPAETAASSASSGPAEAAAPATSAAPVEATASAASAAQGEGTAPVPGTAPVDAAAPVASPGPVQATAPAASSVPSGGEPANPALAASPDNPGSQSLPAPSPAADPIASASTGSDAESSQDKKTDQMIGNMQRMFEQRKQMMQQQQQPAPVPQP